MSSVFRGLVILAVHLKFGGICALDVMLVEVTYRGFTSGLFSAAIQAFRCVRPAWAATLVTMAVIPGAADALEIFVHRICGTGQLGTTIRASLIFTGVSVLFELYAMRRGVLVVGKMGGSLMQDLKMLPKLFCEFVSEIGKCFGMLRSWMLREGTVPVGSDPGSR